ncbi:glutathione S-transferase [Sphingorhabdus sp. Alg239-R122]|uniref:glutathione S-transferase family protein n=1 Tax=Sphingorhabdus sp. Alg239-R122 TaxID=2305989 RepID=UPI0013D97D98|nr:glutathione S-transferase [Sphingorhabdus sp. Alg239-R122]
MKLYDSIRAPNPRRVRWFMAEKRIEDVEIEQVSLFEGQHRTAEYRAKAGLPNVPALELDDGTVFTESIAICRYLESVYPRPNMFGRDASEIAVIEMWTRRAEMMVATPFMIAVRHSHPAMAALEKQDSDMAKTNLKTAERGLKMLDRQLGSNKFIAADRLTIADIIAFTGIDFMRMVKYRPPEELTNLMRWHKVMNERPAAKAGME